MAIKYDTAESIVHGLVNGMTLHALQFKHFQDDNEVPKWHGRVTTTALHADALGVVLEEVLAHIEDAATELFCSKLGYCVEFSAPSLSVRSPYWLEGRKVRCFHEITATLNARRIGGM